MIETQRFSDLKAELSAKLYGKDLSFDRLSIDSRTIAEGDVYLALKGEQFDGHDFIGDALDKGCIGVIGEQEPSDLDGSAVSYLKVSNTHHALNTIASNNRKKFTGKLVGLTGSAGKTSTKNMLRSVLSEFGQTAATEGNFNNEIGVPLTLLDIDAEHQFSVVEMGARNSGDIAHLSNIVQPDVAMVLNAGSAHIEIFGSYEAIVDAKGEIYDSLNGKGIGILNFDDPAFVTWQERLGSRPSLTFSSESKNADVFATEIKSGPDGSTFSLNYLEDSLPVYLPVPGLHQVQNALAAAASALALGCDLAGIIKGLGKVGSSDGRMQTTQLGCFTVLDDSYNANPVSMKAALDVLEMQDGYRIAVLGEMAELGAFAKEAHKEIALHAEGGQIEEICLIGPFARMMAAEIGTRAHVFETKELLAEHLVGGSHGKTVVMIKGSRSAAMEEIISLIKRRVH